MFRTTFLGHQGWLLRTPNTSVLIDPLLTPGFGHGAHHGVVYPPRTLDLNRFPPVDAVVLTHEHDDHFDLPSLHRIDRHTPVWLSARSSSAAHTIVRKMGFAVRPLEADASVQIGDLRFETFTPDLRDLADHDEWDVIPFVAHDDGGHGVFATSVDVPAPTALLDALSRIAGQGGTRRTGVWTVAHNTTGPTTPDLARARSVQGLGDDTEALAAVLATRRRRVEDAWSSSHVSAIVGGGWSYPPPRDALNHAAFPIDGDRLAACVRDRAKTDQVVALVPGQTLVFVDGVRRADESSSFVRVPPRAMWPDRSWNASALQGAPLHAPACGRVALPPTPRDQLISALDPLASFLAASPLMRGLRALPAEAAEGRVPHLALWLRDGDDGWVVRHDPHGARFVLEDVTDPVARFVSGIEIWAADLWGLVTGQLGATAVCHAGRMRVWNHHPDHARLSPHVLWMFAHPLRRPEVALRLYRTLAAGLPQADANATIRSTQCGSVGIT